LVGGATGVPSGEPAACKPTQKKECENLLEGPNGSTDVDVCGGAGEWGSGGEPLGGVGDLGEGVPAAQLDYPRPRPLVHPHLQLVGGTPRRRGGGGWRVWRQWGSGRNPGGYFCVDRGARGWQGVDSSVVRCVRALLHQCEHPPNRSGPTVPRSQGGPIPRPETISKAAFAVAYLAATSTSNPDPRSSPRGVVPPPPSGRGRGARREGIEGGVGAGEDGALVGDAGLVPRGGLHPLHHRRLEGPRRVLGHRVRQRQGLPVPHELHRPVEVPGPQALASEGGTVEFPHVCLEEVPNPTPDSRPSHADRHPIPRGAIGRRSPGSPQEGPNRSHPGD